MRALRVCAGILTRGDRLLICQRKSTDLHPDKWEFPGGKATSGEDDATCLKRELAEELGVDATVGPEIFRDHHVYPNGRRVALVFFHVSDFGNEVVNRVFQTLRWVAPHHLPGYDFLAGDHALITGLAEGRWAHLFAPCSMPDLQVGTRMRD